MARDSSMSRLPLIARIGIGVGLLGLVAVAYFVVFYGDLATNIRAAENQEKTLREQLSEARKAEFAYQKDLADLSDRKQRVQELQKILPTNTEYPSFLSSVQGVANVAGIGLTAWTPQEEVPEQFYARVPMKLELTGRYHQVAKFFYGVGQLERIINMENISITDPTIEAGETQVKVEVLATAFRMLEDAKPGAAGDKRGAAQQQQQQQAPAQRQPLPQPGGK